MSHAERLHARFNFSGAHRWVNCPGSMGLCESVPEQEPGEVAKRGTFLHEICEICVKDFLDYKRTGQPGTQWETHKAALLEEEDEEAVIFAEGYLQHLWKHVFEEVMTGKVYALEDTVTLDEHLDVWGSTDFWAVYINDKSERMGVVVDFKSGYHEVPIKKNPQLMCYALALLKEINQGGKSLDKIKTCIYQPKCGTPWKEQTYTIKQLKAFEGKLFNAVHEILTSKKPKFKTGYWCKFCPAQGICPTYGKELSAQAQLALIDPRDIALPTPESLHPTIMAKLVNYRKAITDFLDAVYDEAVMMHKNGNPLPGLKLVESGGRRTWVKEKEQELAKVLESMKIDPWQKKLITITAAEKKAGKDALTSFIGTTKSSLCLVPSDDPRPTVEGAKDLLEEI